MPSRDDVRSLILPKNGLPNMATRAPIPVTSARLFGARSIPTSELTFNAKVTSTGARNSRQVLMYANVYSEMKPHPTRCTAGDPGSTAASAAEVELLGPADRCPTVVHAELGVDLLRVASHGVQGHHELAGDVRTVQVGSEQPEHVKLTFAERLDQDLFGGRAVLGVAEGGQQSPDIARGDPAFRGRFQQDRHGWALVNEIRT